MKALSATIATLTLGLGGMAQGALVHQWMFEEDSGSTAVNSVAYDPVYNLTMRNASDQSTDLHSPLGGGVNGVGRSFDLSSNNMGNGVVGSRAFNTNVMPGVPFTAVTVTGWFKADNYTEIPGTVVMFRQDKSFLLGYSATNTLRFNMDNPGGGSTNVSSNAGAVANPSQWNFVAVTWDSAAAGAVNFYLGSESSPAANVGSGTIGHPMNVIAGSDFFIGRSSSLNGYFDGWFDDIRIYSTALTSSEVESVRNAAIPEPASMLLLTLAGSLGLLRRQGR